MTVITAIIGSDKIAIATDSLKTKYIKKSNSYIAVEFKRPKIIPVRKYHAAISFWGLVDYGGWSLERFIKNVISSSDPAISLEGFAKYLANQLSEELDRIIPGNPIIKGFGIHLTGFEYFRSIKTPELFLLSNFTDPRYNRLKENIICARQLYPIVHRDTNTRSNDFGVQRGEIARFFQKGQVFKFNNGDPQLYNIIADAYHKGATLVRLRNRVNTMNIDQYRQFARGPVEIISDLQKQFAPKNQRLVGGKIHDLVITASGVFSSSSGIHV